MAIALRKSHVGYSMPTYNARYPGFDENDYAKLDGLATSRGLTGQRKTNFMDQAYQQYYPQVLNNHMLDKRQEQINQGVADNGTALLNGDKNTLWKMRLTDLSQQAKMARGISYDVDDMEVINAMKNGIPDGEQLLLNYLNNGDKEIFYKAGIDDNPREKLKENFWSNLWDNMRTMAAEPVDSMKKWSVRTMNEASSKLFPKIVKKALGDTLPAEMGINFDDYVESFSEGVLDPRLRNLSLEYQDQVNQNAMERRARNLDQDIKNYYDSKGYTKLLKEGDFKGFIYKSMGDAASNWEMPVIIGASIFQPEIGLALMATDTYARENQEAFENMMNSGADYEQAQEGAVVVGLINAGVEVTLDRLLGGVETTASNEIRRIFMKNVQDEAVKKGLGGILMKAGTTQLKSSAEEGLEEVVQQIVQNAAIKTVDENQKLFEGIPQAFEGGFYNPMNLLAGGGNLTSNINANKSEIRQSIMDGAYNAGGALGTAYGKAQNMFSKKNNANTTTTTTENTNLMDKVTDWGAEKITNTVSAQDKLYKAQEPLLNGLSRKRDLEVRREHSDKANQLIIENGYVPTNTSERLTAHEATMKKIWQQVEDKINGGKEIMIDQTELANALQDYIDKQKKMDTSFNESEIAKLQGEVDRLKGKEIDLPTLERKKQFYNAIIKNWGDEKVSDTMANGLQELTRTIGVIEDNLLSDIPGEFQSLKNDFGALKDTYEDVFKADMRNQRRKGKSIIESYSRIEGLGDMAEGLLGILSGQGGKVISGAGKVLLGKSLAKAKDVDFLIKQGYEALAKEMGKEVPTTTENTVETEVSEQENSETPIYKSEKVDIIEPSLDTNLSQMETTKTNPTNDLNAILLNDLNGMKEGDQIHLEFSEGDGETITKVGNSYRTEYDSSDSDYSYQFIKQDELSNHLANMEEAFGIEDYEYLDTHLEDSKELEEIDLNYEGNEEDLEELRQTNPEEYERLMDEEYELEQSRQEKDLDEMTEEDLIEQEREDLRKTRENKEEQARQDFQKQNLKEYMGDMEKGENIRVTFIKQGTDNIKYTTKVTVEKGDGYYMLKYDNGDIDYINDDEVNMWLDTKEVRGFNTVNPDVANSEESIMEILDREPNVPSIEEIRKDFVFDGYRMEDLKNGLQVELDNYSQNVDTWQRYNDREAQHKAAINRAYIEAYKEEIKERENSPVGKPIRSYTAEELGLPSVSATMLKNLDRSKYIPVEDPKTKKVVFFKVEDLEESFQPVKETKKKTTKKKGDTKRYADEAYSPSITMNVDDYIKEDVMKQMRDLITGEKFGIIDTSLYGRPRKGVIQKVRDGYEIRFEDGEEGYSSFPKDLIKDYKIEDYTKPDFGEPKFKENDGTAVKKETKKKTIKSLKEDVNNLISDTWHDIGDEGDWDWYKKMKKKDVITYLEDQVLDEFSDARKRGYDYGLEWSEVQKLIKKFVNERMK